MGVETDTKSAIIPSQKIYYLDHVKLLLTILVVLHHAFIAYGGPSGWYYRQPATDLKAVLPMVIFVSTNQSFFMGLFFLLSAYFIESSIRRKGTWVYLKDRCIRLGIPLLFYSFILSPVIYFMVYHYGMLQKGSFLQYLHGNYNWIDPGVLWFVAALLLFTLLYVVLYSQGLTGNKSISKLKTGYILTIGFGLGLVTFLVRLVFPIGWVLHPVGFIFGYFPQYLVMFTIGIIAGRGKLAENLDIKIAKQFAWLALALLLIVFPLMGYIKVIDNAPDHAFNGGWNVESLLYSFYEQILGVSIMVALTGITRYKWNKPSKFLTLQSRNSFAVYIFHPLVLVAISLLLSRFNTTPTIKLAIAGPTTLIGSFLLAAGIMRIPKVDKVI